MWKWRFQQNIIAYGVTANPVLIGAYYLGNLSPKINTMNNTKLPDPDLLKGLYTLFGFGEEYKSKKRYWGR